MRQDKKVPPPAPKGREGRLFPPEQSSKTADQVASKPRNRNNYLGNSTEQAMRWSHRESAHSSGFGDRCEPNVDRVAAAPISLL